MPGTKESWTPEMREAKRQLMKRLNRSWSFHVKKIEGIRKRKKKSRKWLIARRARADREIREKGIPAGLENAFREFRDSLRKKVSPSYIKIDKMVEMFLKEKGP